MLLRHALLAAMITAVVATANAQTTPPATPGTPPAATTTKEPMATAKDTPAAAETRTPSTPPATAPAPARTATDSRPATEPRTTATAAPPTESTGDFNVHGDVSANAFIGAKIRNDNKDTVGAVQDLYLDASGAIKTVVVSVGGFLGVGAKDVAVKWSDLKQSRDGKSLILMTSLSKDDLKAMPDYTTAERRQPAGKDQAQMPK
ncbi:MAG TPA: PRC-barrel domain-containing protein [Reyranella sp.]|nr:PRC-barrel domain-containing protein [Reyranella sp.]